MNPGPLIGTEDIIKNELNIRCIMSKDMLPAIQAEQAVYVLVDIRAGGIGFGSLPATFGPVLTDFALTSMIKKKEMTMICKECQMENIEGALFCDECGAQLEAAGGVKDRAADAERTALVFTSPDGDGWRSRPRTRW